jgi:hypothetical protein
MSLTASQGSIMNAIQPHVSMYLFNPLSLYIFAKVAENGGPWGLVFGALSTRAQSAVWLL